VEFTVNFREHSFRETGGQNPQFRGIVEVGVAPTHRRTGRSRVISKKFVREEDGLRSRQKKLFKEKGGGKYENPSLAAQGDWKKGHP